MQPHDLSTRGDSEGLWDWNLVSNRIHFSPRWMALVGCEAHEVGSSQEAWLQRVHPEDRSQVSRAIETHLAGGDSEFDIRHRMLHADGSYRWMQCCAVIERDADGRAVRVLGCHADVTAGTVADPQTGLPNRFMLAEHLTRSLERVARYPAVQFALLFIDLDRPGQTDPPSGPVTGDPLLSAAARRLETSLRMGYEPPLLRHGHVVARVQGDQFAILLDGLTDVGHAVVVADRILAGLLAPFTVGDREVFLSASIGIAVSATGYSLADDMLRDAETALHRAQQLGGARCEVFDTAALKTLQTEQRLESEFPQALERREFRLVYQPIVSLSSNQIVGFEALLRWRHPVFGVIPPLEFLPIAERSGFIVPLGNWILREACTQVKTWQDHIPGAKDLWVSVNLSSRQLKHPGLVEQVGQVLRDANFEAHGLVLELTESLAMENPTAVRTLLMRLRALGARISIDDFGTGHSSLAYLRQFPVDALKIDRSFVRGIESNTDMTEILSVVSNLAQQLGLSVVAEGVENEDQVVLVRSLLCEYGQGYLFAKPLDDEKAAELLAAGLPPPEAVTGTNRGVVKAAGRVGAPPGGTRSHANLRLYVVAAVAAALAFLVSTRVPLRSSQAARAELAAPASPGAAEDPRQGPRPGPSGRDIELPVPAAELPASAAAPKPARPAAPVSLAVVHQHRLGSCRGVLSVSRRGVAFVPDEAEGDDNDAFALGYDQFLSDLNGDTLTIRSNDRTYRFKSAVGKAEGDRVGQLERVVAGIARFR